MLQLFPQRRIWLDLIRIRSNRELQATLESEGAEVIEIVTYRWGLPEDTRRRCYG
jgi:uroporphyrinogen-III synthase